MTREEEEEAGLHDDLAFPVTQTHKSGDDSALLCLLLV